MESDVNVRAGTPAWFSLEGEAFVRQAYQRLLGRPADPDGLKSYTQQLIQGLRKEQLVAELEDSPEGRLVARRRGVTRGGYPATAVPAQPRAANEPRVAPAPPPPELPRHVNDLLAADGSTFIELAYLVILGREADDDGRAYYGQRVAAGESKAMVLADLCTGPEVQARGINLPGLAQLLAAARETPPTIAHVNDLLQLHGRAFVRATYVALLGRDADADGLARYVDVLRGGASRSSVLEAIAQSEEARARATELPGLRSFLDAYRRAQARSWGGWYWRTVRGAESDLVPARELRMLAWRDNES
jgi:hypothetical protein